MIPILYDKSEKLFKNNGIGRLSDTISCKVTEKRNSTYQVVLEYPTQGKLSNHLKTGNIIFCKIPYKNQCQPFDIVEVECTGNIIRVTGEHVSRRLKYAVFNRTTLFLVDPKTTFESIETNMRVNIIGIDDFHFSSDVTESDVKKYLNDSNVVLYSPDCAVGDNLFDFFEGQSGILSRKMTLSDGGKYVVTGYGDCGDFLFDNFNVSFLKQRGDDVGVKLRTGTNVQRMTFLEEDRQSVTAVCPVWRGRNPVTGGQMEKSLRDYDESSDGIVYSDKKYEYHRIVKLDLSTVFEQSPTKSEMISEAQRYMKDHERNNLNSYCSYSIDVPSVKSDFLDCIELCDLVTIEDVDLHIQKKLKVTEIEYDSLRERIVRLVVGNPKPTFPELLERKNSIFIDNVNRSLTRTDDLSKKTTVEQKKYPVGYDPAHPENWKNNGGTIVDDTGKEMEEIAKINRHPVFVYKQAQSGGGGASSDGKVWFILRDRINLDYETTLKVYQYSNNTFTKKSCKVISLEIIPSYFYVSNPKENEQYGHNVSARIIVTLDIGTVICDCMMTVKLRKCTNNITNEWTYTSTIREIVGMGEDKTRNNPLFVYERKQSFENIPFDGLIIMEGHTQEWSGVSQ